MTTAEAFDLRMNADCTLYHRGQKPNISGCFFVQCDRGLFQLVMRSWLKELPIQQLQYSCSDK